MKPALSSIINDLITGKARLKVEAFTFTAAAGAAIPETHFFECPKQTLRLILNGEITSTKTTGTAFDLSVLDARSLRIATLVYRTIGTDITCFPIDDGSTKDPAEINVVAPLFLRTGDKLAIGHAPTAGETISDIVLVRWVEWSGVNVL